MSKSPSRWKYIGVWLLAGMLARIVSTLLTEVVYARVYSIEDVVRAMTFGIPLEALVISACIIIVYSAFPSFEMSAVYPWMVGLTSLGVLYNLFIISKFDYIPSWIFYYQIACTAAMLYGIGVFFRLRGRM